MHASTAHIGSAAILCKQGKFMEAIKFDLYSLVKLAHLGLLEVAGQLPIISWIVYNHAERCARGKSANQYMHTIIVRTATPLTSKCSYCGNTLVLIPCKCHIKCTLNSNYPLYRPYVKHMTVNLKQSSGDAVYNALDT